jgi:DNA-binding response OmpR family regulator
MAPLAATILLIEPNLVLLKLVTLILEGSGFEVLVARSAQEAILIDVGFLGRIDLLLSSITLPGTSGPELAKAMKERRHGMLVMFMSGYPDGAMLFLNYGWHFVTKPFVAAQLIARIKHVLTTATPEQSVDRFDTTGLNDALPKL